MLSLGAGLRVRVSLYCACTVNAACAVLSYIANAECAVLHCKANAVCALHAALALVRPPSLSLYLTMHSHMLCVLCVLCQVCSAFCVLCCATYARQLFVCCAGSGAGSLPLPPPGEASGAPPAPPAIADSGTAPPSADVTGGSLLQLLTKSQDNAVHWQCFSCWGENP